MALLGWELKKLWRPGLLAAIALVGLVFWNIRTEFYIEHMSEGWAIELSAGWLERYGTTMEPSERAELDGQLAEAKEEFSAGVAQIGGAAEAGIHDWPSWLAWKERYDEAARANANTERDRDLYWAVQYGASTNRGEIEALETFMERYDQLAAGDESALGHVTDYPDWVAEREARRLAKAAARPEAFGFLPGGVVSSTNNFFHYFAIWCSFSAVLLLSPVLVRDRLHRTRAMQWASRRGRGVLDAQMGAALLSQYSGTYVAMLLKLLPLIFVLEWGLVPWIMDGAGTFWGDPARLLGLPGTEWLIAAACAGLALGLCALACRWQKRRELL